MNYLLSSDRINFRELSLKDEDLIFDLDSDPEVMKYITLGETTSREEVREALSRTEALLKKHKGKFGYWAALRKEDDDFLGWFHFRPSKRDPENTQKIELGYRLRRKYWGKGYATEGSLAFMNYGFHQLKVNEIYAIALKDHMASQKVMEKVGLKFVRDFISPDFPDTTLLDVEYSVFRDEWLKNFKSLERNFNE